MSARASADRGANERGYGSWVVGQTRLYEYKVRTWFIYDDGRVDSTTSSTIYERRVTCRSVVDGQEIFYESFKKSVASDHIYFWTAYRQDKRGLFAELYRTTPCQNPGSEPAPIGFSQRQVLAYPLHPGAHWSSFPVHSQFEVTVEGMDTITVPVGRFNAWRLRIDEITDTGSAQGSRHEWYAREGFIKGVSSGEYYVPPNPPFGGIRVVSKSTEILISETFATP